MVLPEDKYDPIVDALNRINESLEEQNDTLRKISQHYDSGVGILQNYNELLFLNLEMEELLIDYHKRIYLKN